MEPSTPHYVRDALDHVLQLTELVESAREQATHLLNLHMSMLGRRTNEIMRVLTIIATIFIPLTFMAGVYGMNFAYNKSPLNMPELQWYYGYPASLILMALVAGGLITFFWRKGWLGSGD
jgi:magnesium transporter